MDRYPLRNKGCGSEFCKTSRVMSVIIAYDHTASLYGLINVFEVPIIAINNCIFDINFIEYLQRPCAA